MKVSQTVEDRDFPIDISLIMGGTKLTGSESILNEFFSPDLSACGYIEFVTDKDYHLISGKGQAAGTMEADSKKYVRQYISPVGAFVLPWYWEVDYDYKGGIYLDLNLRKNANDKVLMDRDGKVDCVGHLNGAAGVGLYGVVNAQGNLSMDVQTELFPNSHLKISGTADASLRFLKYYRSNVLGPYSFEKTLWDDKLDDEVIQLSESGQSYTLDESIISAMDLWEEKDIQNRDTGLSLMSGVQTVSENDWLGTGESDYQVHGVGAKGKKLLQNSIQGCDPKVVQLGDKSILLFTAITSEDTENAGRLMYSVKVNDTWSTPVMLWDNGCPDYYADLQVIGDRVYVVWQKSSSAVEGLDADAMFDNAIGKSEICVAEFDNDKNIFTNQKYITSNDYLDMLPQFVKGTNQVAVSFITNRNNDYTGMSDSNINLVTFEDGTWSEVSKVATVPGYIGEYETYQSNGSYRILYSSMDISKASEQEQVLTSLYMTDGEITELMNQDANSILGLQYYDDKMFWLCDGALRMMDCTSGQITDLLIAEDGKNSKAVGADFRVIGNGDKTSVVWGAASENGYRFYSSLLMENQLTNPLDMFQHEGSTVESYDVVMNADGSYRYMMNDMNNNDSICTLSEVIKEVYDNPELTSVYMPDYERDDDKQPVSVVITNQGESVIKNLHMKVVSNNTEYVNQEFTTNILPGESACVHGSFILPRIANPKEFSVIIYTDFQGEENASIYTTILGNTDVGVEASKVIDREKAVITYKVTNNSNTETDCTLNVYLGNGCNELVKKFDILELGAGQSEYIKYTVNQEDLNFAANIAAFNAVVETKVDDYRISNNSTVMTLLDEEFPSLPSEEETTTEPDTRPTQEPTTPPGQEPTTSPDQEPTTPVEVVDISNAFIKMEQDEYLYQGEAICPNVTLVLDGKNVSNEHYDVQYYDNINAGKAKVVVCAKKDDSSYTGKAECEFTILKANQTMKAKVSSKKLVVGKGTTVHLTGTLYGSVSYQSLDKKVITVDDKGKLYAKSPGTAEIIVSINGNDNYNGTSTTFKVTVLPDHTNIVSIDNIGNGVNISWKKSSMASGYYIYRSTGGNQYKRVANISSGAVTKWKDINAVSNGTKYAYKIIAYTKTGNQIYKSRESKEKCFYFMSAPRITKIRNHKTNRISVAWSKNQKASGYEIQYVLGSAKKTIRINTGSVASKIINNLKKGKSYRISIRSYKKSGNVRYYSKWSKAIKYTV